MQKIIFSDLNENMTSQRVDNLKSIRQSVYNLLLTSPNQRLFNLDYGVGVDKELFETIDTDNAFKLYTRIKNGVMLFESPRIEMLGSSRVIPKPLDYMYIIDLELESLEVDNEIYSIRFGVRG